MVFYDCERCVVCVSYVCCMVFYDVWTICCLSSVRCVYGVLCVVDDALREFIMLCVVWLSMMLDKLLRVSRTFVVCLVLCDVGTCVGCASYVFV